MSRTLHSIRKSACGDEFGLALIRQEFVLHYQPEIALQTNAVVGAEALIRWQHPVHGLLWPAQFLAAAKAYGMLAAVGRWVLREACQQGRLWQDQGIALRMAVNVSADEIAAPNFVANLRRTLLDADLSPSRLELEVTESLPLPDTKSFANILRAVDDIGVHLALDDFGTGYSSLTHLRRFPVRTLKIDRSFVRDLDSAHGDASIIGAIVSMAREREMRVVAEGVETRRQADILEALGCSHGQGYHFAKPLPIEQFEGVTASDSSVRDLYRPRAPYTGVVTPLFGAGPGPSVRASAAS